MSRLRTIGVAAMAAVLFSLPSTAGVDIDIKGKIVIPSGDSVSFDSVPGASLFLKNHPEVRCSTDEHGEFRLTNNPNAILGQAAMEKPDVQMRVTARREGFLVNMTGGGNRLDVGIYNAEGRILASGGIEGPLRRDYFMPFSTASAVHLIKISSKSGSWIFKTIPAMGFVITDNPQQQGERSALHKRRSAFYSDTLVVFLKGFRTGLFGIDSYVKTGFIGKMELSNSWVNCQEPMLMAKKGGMIRIAAKDYDFEMGQFCDTIWGKRDGNSTSDLEQPQHTVFFTNHFFMDSTEIPQGEYDSLMKAAYSGYIKPAWSALYGMGSNYPAYSVSWDDAILFCNARSKRDHLDTVYSYSGITGTPGALSKLTNVSAQISKTGYRLPTEAEWEYACKAGTTADFFWERDYDYYKQTETDIFDEANSKAVWAKNSWELGSGEEGFGAHPVTDMEYSFYDLYGMTGNVSEWCHDWVGKYQWGAAIDPTGPDTGASHVLRGGNWGNGIFYLRSANRYFASPEGLNENLFKGFRTVRTAGENE